jgi:hypothetical protein
MQGQHLILRLYPAIYVYIYIYHSWIYGTVPVAWDADCLSVNMSLNPNPHLKTLQTLGIKMTLASLKSTDKHSPPSLKFP